MITALSTRSRLRRGPTGLLGGALAGLLVGCGAPPAPAATPPVASISPASAASGGVAGAPTSPLAGRPLEGMLLGAPFHPVAACVSESLAEGRVKIEIYDAPHFDVKLSCGTLGADPGARSLAMVVPWKLGSRFDLKTHATSEGLPGGYVAGYNAKTEFELKAINKDFHPTGSVEILRSGQKQGEVGRIRLSFVNGAERLEGEIDVYVKRDITAP